MSIEILQKDYLFKKQRIQSRLKEFEQIISQGDEKIFEELCFCILTANTSAKAGIKSIEYLKPILITGKIQQLADSLILSGYRFPNKRAEYIVEARKFLQKELNFKQKDKEFAQQLNINEDELDLLLWSRKNGEILK